jgi:Glycosyl hydrolases family 2
MSIRIRRVELSDQTLVPAEAEVWVTVHLDHLTTTTAVRGRFMGPTCRYASTVEVAYQLRSLGPSQKPPASEGPALTTRVVIPEPSFWDPESPFLYQGPVEVWEDGERRAQVTVRHGLRSRTLGPRGLRWNERPLTLRGRSVTACSEHEMLALRDAGYNLLVAAIAAETPALGETADRLGFLVLGRAQALDDPLTADLARHPSWLGFLFDAAVWAQADPEERERFRARTHGLIGVDSEAPPPDVDFLTCPAERWATAAAWGLPLLLWGKNEGIQSPVVGWVE